MAKSRGAKPSEKLLHAIGKDDDTRDDSQERVDIIRIGLQKDFDHGSHEVFRMVALSLNISMEKNAQEPIGPLALSSYVANSRLPFSKKTSALANRARNA